MSLSNVLNKCEPRRLLSIDPSSKSLAWCVVDLDKDSFTILSSGKIDYADKKDFSERLPVIKKELEHICSSLKINAAVIEQSVYIQNFQTSRILSYIIGFSWGTLMNFSSEVCDVNPLVWKNKIGYRNISKEDKAIFKSKYGEKGLQLKLKQERKDRVKKIVLDFCKFDCDDDDINDAVGIALWYYIENGYGTL